LILISKLTKTKPLKKSNLLYDEQFLKKVVLTVYIIIMKTIGPVKIESLDKKCQIFFELNPIKTFSENQPLSNRYHLDDLDYIDLRNLLYETYKVKIAIDKIFKCVTLEDLHYELCNEITSFYKNDNCKIV
jgi:hypothetical protein